MTRKNATFIGLIAIVLWSMIVGLVRGVSEILGPAGGAAMIYSLASVLLLFTVGFPKINTIPRSYLFWGSAFFVAYEVCFVLAIGYANSSTQAVEVNIVNYLWPSLTILFSIMFNNQKSTPLVIPGLIISLLGVCWVLGGDKGLDWGSMEANVRSNPIAYSLAFVGAFLWAIYCVLTNKISGGKNGITLFFMLTALVLWVNYFVTGGGKMLYSHNLAIQLAMAAIAVGCGYAAWNIGILYGNVTILSGASYFTPIFSSLLSALLLQTTLPLSFWQGALMVSIGSTLCWYAMRAKS